MGIFDFFKRKEKEEASKEKKVVTDESEDILLEFDLIDKAAEDDRISMVDFIEDYDFIKLVGYKRDKEEISNDELIEEFILTFLRNQTIDKLASKIANFNFIQEFLGSSLKDLILKYKSKNFSGYKELFMYHNCAERVTYVISKNLIALTSDIQETKEILSLKTEHIKILQETLLEEVIDEGFKNSEDNISWTHEEKVAYLKIQLLISSIKGLSDKNMMAVVFPNMECLKVKMLKEKEIWNSRKDFGILIALHIIEDMSSIKKSIVSRGIKLIVLCNNEFSESEEKLLKRAAIIERLEKILNFPKGWFLQTMVN